MNEDSLFDIPEMLSPYLQWERGNNIKADQVAMGDHGWFACQTELPTAYDHWNKYGGRGGATGYTRDDAVAQLCARFDIPVFRAEAQQ